VLTGWVIAVAAVLVVGSLPYWLPDAVVALRMWIFTRVNGDEGVSVPGGPIDAADFRRLYEHPAANGRSRGAVLSDLFWYWLSPGAELHQEHLEPGPAYDEVALATRRILAVRTDSATALTARCAAGILDGLGTSRTRTVRLRDLMMPVWAEVYYEIVFAEPCPRAARDLIVGNANDVVTALKCTGLRHLRTRDRLTRYLMGRIERGEVPHDLPGRMSTRERALYLQGVFFNTAVVQMSEAMAHLFLVLAEHPQAQARLAGVPDDDRYLDNVINEALRLYPLFGIAHRITSADIPLDGDLSIPAGSVLCFSYPQFHRTGYEEPDEFRPERWESTPVREANHIPFGVAANRPCPAWRLAPITMRAVVRETLGRYALYSSAEHTRALPNRGPCLLVPRDRATRPPRTRLLGLRVRDRWEDVWRSVAQLVLGTYMVWDARRHRLCQRYFAEHPDDVRRYAR
jgi:hypothetical protein